MGRKTGNKPKDAAITDNFNEKPINGEPVYELQKRITDLANKLHKKEKKESKPKMEPEEEVDDSKLRNRLMSDMLRVYTDVGGRRKLLKLLKGDDKLLIAMVKELMKYEVALMSSEMKSKEYGNTNMATFVILKGLKDDEVVSVTAADSEVDLKQVQGVLNPEQVEQEEYEPEIEGPKI